MFLDAALKQMADKRIRCFAQTWAFRENSAYLLSAVEVPELQLYWFGKSFQCIKPSALNVHILLCLGIFLSFGGI